MRPALADALVLVCAVTLAVSVASPLITCQTRWSWSLKEAMSAPEPATVHPPPLSDWSPTSAGLPMSAQLQPAGQGEAGGKGRGTTEGTPRATPLIVAEPA